MLSVLWLFTCPFQDVWWVHLIRLAVFGLFFLWLTLWKHGREKKPWEYKLLRFRWLLLPLMASSLLSTLRTLISRKHDLYAIDGGLIACLWEPLFFFLLSYLISTVTQKRWVRLLPLFVLVGDLTYVVAQILPDVGTGRWDFSLMVMCVTIVPMVTVNSVMALLGFFLGRLWAKKREKKEAQVLEEAV